MPQSSTAIFDIEALLASYRRTWTVNQLLSTLACNMTRIPRSSIQPLGT